MKVQFKQFMNKACQVAKDAAPGVLLVTGIAGVVVTVVVACTETKAANDILDKHKELMSEVHDRSVDSKITEASTGEVVYPEEQKQKETIAVYKDTAVKLVKNYWPAAALGVCSIACIIVSSKLEHKRYLRVLTELGQVTTEYTAYRALVAEKVGAEEEVEIHHQAVKFVEDPGEYDNLINLIDETKVSGFTIVFNKDTSSCFTGDPQLDKYTIDTAFEHTNRLLDIKGKQFVDALSVAMGINLKDISDVSRIFGIQRKDENDKRYFSYRCEFPSVDSAYMNGTDYTLVIHVIGVEPEPLIGRKA